MANPFRLGALVCASLAVLCALSGPTSAEPIKYKGAVVLDTGVTTQGDVPVSSTNPLPVTSTSATQATAGSDATKATAVQGITGGTPVHTAIVDSAGNVVDVSQNAIISGSVSITNSAGTLTAGMQQNSGSDDLSNSGSSSTALLLTRGFLHAWDPTANSGAGTWSRVKGSKVDGLLTSPYGLKSESWKVAATSGGVESSTADNTIQAANATKVHCITDMTVSYGTLSGVAEFIVKDGSTVIFRERLDTTASRFSRPPGGRPLCGTANTAMVWALGASVTGKVYANFAGMTQ